MRTKTITKVKSSHPRLISGRERLAIWEKVRGMWKNRKPDPIQELRKIRKGWNRKLAASLESF